MAPETLSPPAGKASRRKLTPPEYAKLLGVDTAKILKWIRSGELRAIDASTHRGCKPRYLIDVADIVVFEEARAVSRRHRARRGAASRSTRRIHRVF